MFDHTDITDGVQRWYVRDSDGDLLLGRRDDLPAIVWDDGDQWWCKLGTVHRETGPAIIRGNSVYYWYLNDQGMSFKNWAKLLGLDSDTVLYLALKWPSNE